MFAFRLRGCATVSCSTALTPAPLQRILAWLPPRPYADEGAKGAIQRKTAEDPIPSKSLVQLSEHVYGVA